MYNAGAQVGPYTVVEKLGAGGMGEVYRARDTLLHRDVALKVLLPIFASDPDRLQRFKQEALATGKLNHPNIVGIYAFGEHEGSPYMVSELLEGQTLRQVLSTARLSMRKTLQYAVQMARGLSAAHAQSIVHRDLKPENLFITKDGILKILDFGIAKLAAPEARVGETQAYQKSTGTGVVMGTPGYMSPEQVRGQITDSRSDIFAFGAILYEMLAGRPAFLGDTPTDLIAAILRDDPAEIELGNSVPSLEAIIRHCLEKNPEERLQSARDVAFTLQDLLTAIQTERRRPATATQFLRWPWPLYALLLITLAASMGIAWDRYSMRPLKRGPLPAATLQESRLTPDFQQVTFRRGTIHDARFAPDANSIIYGAALNGEGLALFISRAGGIEERSLDLSQADIFAVSAKDNALVVFPQRNKTLAQVPLSGGTPHEIEQGVDDADWTSDESDIAVVRKKDARSQIEFPIGHVLYATAGTITHLRFSPNGKLIAFLEHPSLLDSGGTVAIIDRDGNRLPLSENWASVQGLAWSPHGNEVWFTAAKSGMNRQLWAVSLTGQLRQLLATPDVLTLQDVSGDQVLLKQENASDEVMGLLAGAKNERDFSWLDFSSAADLAPDGQKILLNETGQAGGIRSAVYLRNADAAPPVRLGDGEALALSPDGQWALARLHDSSDKLILLPTNLGRPKEIKNDNIVAYHAARWLPDSKQLIFAGNQPGHGTQLYLQSIDDGKPQAITPEDMDLGNGSFAISPDGKSVAAKFAADEKVYIYSLSGGNPHLVNGTTSEDGLVAWSRDARELYLRDGKHPEKIDRLEIASGHRRQLKILNTPAGAQDSINSVLVTSDAKWYAYNATQTRSNLFIVKNLQ
jgi:eukaryotic-like serine/threonine-protein kinase